jgi:hypothetical protein
MENGKFEEAYDISSAVIEKAPPDFEDAYVLRADASFHLCKQDQVLTGLDKAESIDPDNFM